MPYMPIGFLAGVGGNRTGIGEYIRQLNAAGRPAVVMSYDDAGLIAEAQSIGKQHGVDNVLAFRPATIYGGENPDYLLPPVVAADAYYDRWIAGIPAEIDRRQVWCIAFNEGRKESAWANWWGFVGLQFAKRAVSDGVQVALFGWSAGTPEPDGYDTVGWAALLHYIDTHHDRVAIAVHEGANPADPSAAAGTIPLINNAPWISGRYRLLWQRADALGVKRPQILVTECAWKYDRAAPLDIGMGHVRDAARFYAGDGVLGVGLWWLGSGHGGVANTLQPYIAPVTELALSDDWQPAAPPPVQPPPVQPPPVVPPVQPPPVAGGHPQSVPDDIGVWDPFKFALAVRIYADGLRVSSEEWDAQYNGERWLYQEGMDAAGRAYIYGVPFGEWDKVQRVAPKQPNDVINDIVYDLPAHETKRYARRPISAIRGVTIHHTASPASVDAYAVAAYHVNSLDWPGIGYHYMIAPDGAIDQCQPILTVSYHDTRNHDTVGVCLRGRFMDGAQPTAAQVQAAVWLVSEIERQCGRALVVRGHKDISPTACPGDTWPQWWPGPIGEVVPPPPPAANEYDMLDYLRGDGRLYELRHSDGGQERIQTQSDGARFYHVKGENSGQYEQFSYDDAFIYRSVDTSPGNGRYYIQRDPGSDRARWLPRRMRVGVTWRSPVTHQVQFYHKAGCVPSMDNSGPATNVTTFVAHYDSWVSRYGITLRDVIELAGTNGERFWYARGYGLVAWRSEWGHSEIAEVHAPGDRPNITREIIPCL